jgi:hypothetical protein
MISLIFTLALIGLIVYLITTYIPMPAIFQTIIYVIVAVVLIIYLMRVFGIGDIPVPHIR